MTSTDGHEEAERAIGLALASTAADGSPRTRAHSGARDDQTSMPVHLGRYRIRRKIGAGGMGSVFVAHDVELEREVAVKLLHRVRGEAEGKRLLREAKALAKLSHPNVVQVYDAGTVDDRVFLVMELVRGTDLRGWLRACPRPWREVVDAFMAAGRGLAAAHAVGLVHRDFKPHNVLVGDDGVVKVADFGLVRAAEGGVATGSEPDTQVLVAADESLTRTGALVGTPAYMAPEQHLALDTDARTDQFSFCVALYEGVVGCLPFRASSLLALGWMVQADRVEFPRRPRVPVGLRRVIKRGLRTRPEDRFPEMSVLLEALARVRRPRRRGWAGVLAAGAAVLLSRSDARDPAATMECDSDAKARTIWDDEARDRVRAHLVEVGAQAGERAADAATQAIDDYLATWREAYAITCEAEPAADEVQVLARRLCLQSRLQEARGVISVLAQADAAVASSVPQIVAALEPVAQCQGELRVVRTTSTANDELSFELARARSLWHARRAAEAEAAAQALAKRAADADETMIESDAWLLAGMIAFVDAQDADRVSRGRSAFAAALAAAQTVGDPGRSLRAEVWLAALPADDSGATVLADLERLAPRIDASSDPIASWVRDFVYTLPFFVIEEGARREHARRLLEVATKSFGPGHRFMELSRDVAAREGITPYLTAEQRRDVVDEAAATFGADDERAIEARERLAHVLVVERRYDDARVELDAAATAWTKIVGPKSTQVGGVWRQIAFLEKRRGDEDAALFAYARAIEALESNPAVTHDGENDALSSTWFDRARSLLDLGRVQEAVAAVEEGRRQRHPRNDGGLGEHWGDLFGRVLLAAGDPEGALRECAAARETWAGAEESALFFGVTDKLDVVEAETMLALGRPQDALGLLRAAWVRLGERKDRRSDLRVLRARAGLGLARTLATLDANDPEIPTIVTAALASLPAEGGTLEQTRLHTALLALRK